VHDGPGGGLSVKPHMTMSKAEIKARTRARLTEAALDLFDRQGFDATPVTQIAATAGVIERTFFNHFPTKADVLFPKREESMRTLFAELSRQPATVSDVDALLDCGTRWLLEGLDSGIATHRRLVRIRLENSSSPLVMAKIVQLMAELTSTMVAALGVRHGRAEPSVADQALGTAAGVLLRLAFESWLEGDQSESLRQAAEKYLKVLRPDPGVPASPIAPG
jgi:AcrR family transcriptional regulator